MRAPFLRLKAYLFTPIAGSAFGLMRAFWGGAAFLFFLAQWRDVISFYTGIGVLSAPFEALITRSTFRFTVLDWVTDPSTVFLVYLLLLASTFCTMIGFVPRLATIVSVVLMYSFHERNPLILGGGDTVLRMVGFLLCIAPRIDGFSLQRLQHQWQHWKRERVLLPTPQQEMWVYRLLLWQVIVIYLTSVWFKLLGTMWIKGTAVNIALQHEVFARWPRFIMNAVLLLAPLITYITLIFEGLWILLLVPRSVTRSLFGFAFQPQLKRWLIAFGFLFHLGIFVVMDVGSFSIAMFCALTGLLIDEDFTAIRSWLNKRWTTHYKLQTTHFITAFYDGHCGLCLRSLFTLQMVDWLGRLQYVDFRNESARQKHAPDLSLETLDRAMHIRFADGRTLHGFDAFRALSWHLPPFWLAAPLLYLPGIPFVGRNIYAWIADSRQKCGHEGCKI